jgi:hypothetical protein
MRPREICSAMIGATKRAAMMGGAPRASRGPCNADDHVDIALARPAQRLEPSRPLYGRAIPEATVWRPFRLNGDAPKRQRRGDGCEGGSLIFPPLVFPPLGAFKGKPAEGCQAHAPEKRYKHQHLLLAGPLRRLFSKQCPKPPSRRRPIARVLEIS